MLLTSLHPDLRPGPLSPGTREHLLSWSPHLHPCFLQSVLNTQSGSSLKGKSDCIPISAQNSSMSHLIRNKNEKPHKGSHGRGTTPSLGRSSSSLLQPRGPPCLLSQQRSWFTIHIVHPSPLSSFPQMSPFQTLLSHLLLLKITTPQHFLFPF